MIQSHVNLYLINIFSLIRRILLLTKHIFKYVERVLILVLSFIIVHLHGQENFISTGDSWEYFDSGEPSENWMNFSVGEKDWKSGPSPLGYGDDIIVTNISPGLDSLQKDITKYFKKTIVIDDPYKFFMFQINVQRDDGIVLYLNGYEIWRDNMPEGPIGFTTQASNLVFSKEREELVLTSMITPDKFVYGKNTLSASVHQAQPTSSDLLFNLELIGIDDPSVLPSLLKEQNIQHEKLTSEISELTYKMENERLNLQYNFSQKSNKTLKSALITILGALIFILIAFYMVLIKQKSHRDQLLRKVNEQDSLLKDTSHDVLSSSMSSIKKANLIKEIKSEIEGLVDSSAVKEKKLLKGLLVKMDNNINHEEEWNNFMSHFRFAYTQFLENLNAQFPTLSEIELRHCIFIKLHMQTKEIARILNVDPRSVQSARYRIKKKMNLEEDVDLKKFVQSL